MVDQILVNGDEVHLLDEWLRLGPADSLSRLCQLCSGKPDANQRMKYFNELKSPCHLLCRFRSFTTHFFPSCFEFFNCVSRGLEVAEELARKDRKSRQSGRMSSSKRQISEEPILSLYPMESQLNRESSNQAETRNLQTSPILLLPTDGEVSSGIRPLVPFWSKFTGRHDGDRVIFSRSKIVHFSSVRFNERFFFGHNEER